MSHSAFIYPIKGLYYLFWEENRAILWQRIGRFALEVALSSMAILSTLLSFTFRIQRASLHLILPDFLYHTVGTVALIMIETAIPVVVLFHKRHRTIQEKLFEDVLQLQGVTVARASPKEYEWIQQQREIQTQALAARRQSISALPSILIDPETMSNYPRIKYFITLPLNFIPIFGQALFCWLNAMETATALHKYYYSELKGLSAADRATIIHSRKAEYIEFGLVASALTLLPGFNVILILTNAVGAALWVADIEREIQRQS
ncbi:unnamed protein product [Calypogeia fissa]